MQHASCSACLVNKDTLSNVVLGIFGCLQALDDNMFNDMAEYFIFNQSGPGGPQQQDPLPGSVPQQQVNPNRKLALAYLLRMFPSSLGLGLA